MPRRDKDMKKYSWLRAHPRLAVALLIVIMLVITGTTYYLWPRTIYVTDGSHVFNSNLREVENLIRAENERVTSTGQPYVSIAFLQTMRPIANIDGVTDTAVRHQLEGAYVAQWAANHPLGKPQLPLIRLLLADEGNQEQSWSTAAAELERAVGTDDHLVAVTGLGISVGNTSSLVQELADHQIAMVGATLTADDLSGIPGMVRVAPTNSDEATAAVKYLDRDTAIPPTARVLLVQDQNKKDDYAASLGKAFTTLLARSTAKQYLQVNPAMAYDSSLAEAGTILGANTQRVCSTNVDIVYFAGRGDDLQGFLSGLAARDCAATKPLTVVTGDGASDLAGRPLWQGNSANLTVVFTGLAHPEMWQRDASAAAGATVAKFGQCGSCFGGLFRAESLDDGEAIMAHDAMLTAQGAVHQITAYLAPTQALPSASAVAQALYPLSVPGASGYICFNDQHNPLNKAIPVIEIDQNGRLQYISLSSVNGTPPRGGCTP
jgi:ABC-type branched-subunit amino acid transport system substrate-binding protein